MLEPQSTLLFVLLIALFGVLMWRIIMAGRLAIKITAACLSFVVAMSFGVLAVNRYFGYYQTWGSAIDDLTNKGIQAGPQVPENSLLATGTSATQYGGLPKQTVYLRLALQQGFTLRLEVRGLLSHITRVVYAYLPPQYFRPQFDRYRFPVIELIHGQPGLPQDWINVAGVQVTLDSLVNKGLAKPAVLVMPDANGGNDISLQCLNQVKGPQDLTYLGLDVPDQISRLLRVQPPGPGWGIAGYSEGGFCAANMALQLRRRYGFAASLSGYFSPMKNQLGPDKLVNPFGANRALRAKNTPLDEVAALHAGELIPLFWIGAGKADAQDVANAEYFWQELELHQANVPLILTADGGHTMTTWRAEIPPMLTWMTNGLAQNVAAAAQYELREGLIARHAKNHRRKDIYRRV
jgi:enterochelin esterase-like enzyme